MIIWCSEHRPHDLPGPMADMTPPGTVEITRVEERGGHYHVWFVPVPARPADLPTPGRQALDDLRFELKRGDVYEQHLASRIEDGLDAQTEAWHAWLREGGPDRDSD